MDFSQLDLPEQVALAQIRVSLADIAPEIPEQEIVPDARIFEDLRLDLVTKWALAVELERITKSELLDREIHAAATVSDFIQLISGSEVTQKLAREGQPVFRAENAADTSVSSIRSDDADKSGSGGTNIAMGAASNTASAADGQHVSDTDTATSSNNAGGSTPAQQQEQSEPENRLATAEDLAALFG